MANRNIRNFIDPSALPLVVPIPFTGLTSAAAVTVDSGVISTERDFYGTVVRSAGYVPGLFQFVLTDGEGIPLSPAPIDGVLALATVNEIVRNLGESGRLVPIFAPKGTKITVVLTTALAGPISGMIEVRGNTIKG
ncbi:MAG TPA: hypothetical protein VEK15_20525 [Vicinamibacteria bacterium]|nr:hypothetical protein [Vicinamibacteria bacterium]